jgi:hypothetical protein
MTFFQGEKKYHTAVLWTAPALLDSTQESCDLGQSPQSLALRDPTLEISQT